MKQLFLVTIFLIFIFSCSTTKETMYYAAPSSLPNVTKDMKTAGLWVSLVKEPDLNVMSPEEIQKFNARTYEETKKLRDFTKEVPTITAAEIKNNIGDDLVAYKKKKLFYASGKKVDKKYFETIDATMNLKDLTDPINFRYGFVRHYTSERVFPTLEAINPKPLYFEVDDLQNNALDIGMPLIIVHESLDKKFVYAKNTVSEGWVLKSDITFTTLEEWKNYQSKKDFIIATNPKTEIYMDPNLTKYYDYVLMGVRLPLSKKLSNGSVEVLIPNPEDGKDPFVKAYMQSNTLSFGYLRYAPRMIYTQAFKFLNAPYGWGGQFGEQDCSRFVQAVFSTVGIKLPRNSRSQGMSGLALLTQENLPKTPNEIENKVIELAVGGLSIIQFDGHISIYLGSYNNRAYIIHESVGYKQNINGQEYFRTFRKVAVTDMWLGEGTKGKTMLEDIKNVRGLYK